MTHVANGYAFDKVRNRTIVMIFLFIEYVDIFVSDRNVTFELVIRVFYGFAFFGNIFKYSYISVTFAGSRGEIGRASCRERVLDRG